MKQETFILRKTKMYRHTIKIFLKSFDGTIDKRNTEFSTQHLVREIDRVHKARTIPAQFATADKRLIEAMYRDTGYGKTFVHIDDPKGERKKESFNVTPLDVKKIALKNLFVVFDIPFDDRKSAEVLQEELNAYMKARSGVNTELSTATKIEHTPVDVEADIASAVSAAKSLYEEKYKEPVPEEFANDKAFLSSLADPKFDAKAYIEKKTTIEPEADELPDDIDDLRDEYFAEFEVNVPTPKKNDIGWMKLKIRENREGK